MMTATPSIAVVGAGAVGCYFGGLLARAGEPVVLIGRPAHAEAIDRRGLIVHSIQFDETIRVRAATDLAAAAGARLVLFCVKTPDTESVARALQPHLAPGAVIVSLQNGVDNVERIYRVTGVAPLAAAVYVAVQMIGPGELKHTGRGDLVVGDLLAELGFLPPREADLAAVRERFTQARVPCRVSARIRPELWTKLLMNCALNAISAVTGERYGAIVADAATRRVIEDIIRESVATGAAAGVRLDVGDMTDAVWQLVATMPDTLSSTAQDLQRGRPTEIDALNGYISRLGGEHGIDTPVNRTLHALVKLREKEGGRGKGEK
jgi:2-dehydropantoate 2-reductase